MIPKLLSGRFLSFMMITATLCYCSVVSVNAALGVSKVDPAVKDVVEKVAMFILGAFVSIATGIYKEYYDRSDRKQPEVKI
jgi:hypothetical protein